MRLYDYYWILSINSSFKLWREEEEERIAESDTGQCFMYGTFIISSLSSRNVCVRTQLMINDHSPSLSNNKSNTIISNKYSTFAFVLSYARMHAMHTLTHARMRLTDSFLWILSVDYCAPNNLCVYFVFCWPFLFLLFMPTPESHNTQQNRGFVHCVHVPIADCNCFGAVLWKREVADEAYTSSKKMKWSRS